MKASRYSLRTTLHEGVTTPAPESGTDGIAAG
jgi:hypothetical protein